MRDAEEYEYAIQFYDEEAERISPILARLIIMVNPDLGEKATANLIEQFLKQNSFDTQTAGQLGMLLLTQIFEPDMATLH